ncbi:ATP-binding protein [Nocardiopsis coralliicola]
MGEDIRTDGSGPGTAPGPAGPPELRPRAAGRAVVAALWGPPGAEPRALPVPPSGPVPGPVLGGVCAAIAQRRGVPVQRVRWLFALTVLPLLAYPLLWTVHAAAHPRQGGGAALGSTLLFALIAIATGFGSFAFLLAQGSPPVASLLTAATVGLPLLLLASSPLLVWRIMTAAAVAAAVLPREGGDPGGAGVLVPALPAYLAVLFCVGRQYAPGTALAAGGAAAAVGLSAAAASGTASGPVWSAAGAAAAVALGTALRTRALRSGTDRDTAPDSGGRGRPSAAAAGPGAAVQGLVDAVWREPVRRPGGPARLLGGRRRPQQKRIIGGVCAALAGNEQAMRVVLRIAAIFFAPWTVLGYLPLWLVLPSERDPQPPDEDAAGPPVTARERAAWGVLCIAAGLAALAAAAQLSQFHGLSPAPSVLVGAAAGLPLALLPVAPLLAWRIAAAGMAAGVAAVGAAGAPPNDLWPWPAAGLVVMGACLYAVAAAHPARTAGGAAAATVVAGLFAAVPLTGVPVLQPAWLSAVAVGCTVLGASARSRRTAQRELARESALRRRDRQRQAAAEERSRIARELHDVVSHHMSMIAIQAEAAPYKYPDLPEGAAQTFTAIRDASRGALSEMRRVVGLLRADGDTAERAPQPDLSALGALVDGARRAGLRIDFDDRSAAAGADPAAARSAYRIVQESLSNAARHAEGADVAVRVGPAEGGLEVVVENGPPPGPAPAPVDAGGHGLVGMRERAVVLGGTLEAGALPGGGFRVRAVLPSAPAAGLPAAAPAAPPQRPPDGQQGPAGPQRRQ